MQPRFEHVIFDRDGVLNAEPPDGQFVLDWSQWHWLPGALDGLARLSAAGIRVSVATNQSCVGRGLLTRQQLDALHLRMRSEVLRAGGVIHHVFVCPHAPDDGCSCRKPAPGLLLDALLATGIPRTATLAVGDDLRDLEAAQLAGIPAALVRTGKGDSTATTPVGRATPLFDGMHDLVAALLTGTLAPRCPEAA